jgi:hypothetical protein
MNVAAILVQLLASQLIASALLSCLCLREGKPIGNFARFFADGPYGGLRTFMRFDFGRVKIPPNACQTELS